MLRWRSIHKLLNWGPRLLIGVWLEPAEVKTFAIWAFPVHLDYTYGHNNTTNPPKTQNNLLGPSPRALELEMPKVSPLSSDRAHADRFSSCWVEGGQKGLVLSACYDKTKKNIARAHLIRYGSGMG